MPPADGASHILCPACRLLPECITGAELEYEAGDRLVV
jgi:hypothetical protein